MATLDADEYALDELTCPITGEIYVDPVLCVGDGHTYERHAATRWLATHTTSPLTGEQMQPEGMRLVDNHLVRKQAAAVLRRRPELHPTWPDPANATPSAPPLGPALGRDFGQNDFGQKSDNRYGTDGAATARETPHDSSRVPVPYVCIAGTGVATRDKKKHHPLRVFSVFPLKPAPRWERVGAGCSGDGFLACSRDGALLACGAQNSSVVTAWRPEFSSPSVTFEPGTRINPTARPPVTTDAADDWVLCGAVAPNAAWVCAAGRGEFVHVWRVDASDSNDATVTFGASEKIKTVPLRDAPWHKDFTTCLVALDDQQVVYGTQDWCARRVDFGSGKPGGNGSLIGQVSASPTRVSCAGNVVAVGTEDGTVRVFDLRVGERCIFDLTDHTYGASADAETVSTTALALANDQRYLLHGARRGGWIREGPRASFRVRHRLDAGITDAVAMPQGAGNSWRETVVVGAVGVGTVLVNAETGVFSKKRITNHAPRALCAFANANAGPDEVSDSSHKIPGPRPGWWERVFG